MTSPTARDGAPAGRRVSLRLFWLIVSLFAIANAVVWMWYDRAHQIKQRDALTVVAVTPEEGGVVEEQRPTFSWTFNMDVTPPAPGVAALDPGIITPAVAGEWQWASARKLTFAPRESLPRATRFTVSLQAERLKSVDGFVLPKSAVSTFQTPALSLVDVRQTRFMEDDSVVLELEFSDPVLPADVIKHLSLFASPGDEEEEHDVKRLSQFVQPALYGEHSPELTKGGRIVRVRTSLGHLFANSSQREMKLAVGLSKGLAGTSGPLGMEEPIVRQIEVAGALVAMDASARSPRDNRPYLRVRFNNPVRSEDLGGLITVEPAVPFTLSGRDGDESVQLDGEFVPATRYTVTIAKGPTVDVKKYPRPAMFSVFVPDRDAAVWFADMHGYLGAHGNRAVLARAVNQAAVLVSVERIYDSNIVIWRNMWGGTASNVTTEIASKKYILQNVKNKVEDVRIVLDELLPKDQPIDGAYRITLRSASVGSSSEETREPYYGYWLRNEAIVTVSDIGLTAKQTSDGKTSGVVAWAVSLSTAKPLAGVTVRAFSSKNQALGEAVTDEHGVARIESIVLPKEERISVLLADRTEENKKTGLTWLDLRNSQRDMGALDTAGAPYHHAGYDAYVYTDRGVYRPGETVVVRSIVRGPGLVKADAFPVRFTLRRPDGRVYRHNVVALDTDGAAEWRVSMPQDLPTGRWSVSLGLPGDEKNNTPFGGAAFGLEDFMPDRMKVAVTLGDGVGATLRTKPVVEGRISLADTEPAYNILVATRADYLFGQPAAKLQAQLIATMHPTTFSAKDFSGYTFGDAADAGSVFGALPRTGRRFAPAPVTLSDSGAAIIDVDIRGPSAPIAAKADAESQEEHEAIAPGRAGDAPVPMKAYAFKGPWHFAAGVSVIENGGRSVTENAAVVLDEMPYYLGVRATNVRLDTPGNVEIALVTPGGQLADAAGSVRLTLLRETWNNTLIQVDRQYRYISTRLLTPVKRSTQTVSVGGGKGSAKLEISESGAYVLHAYDPKTQQVSTVSLYVYGGAGGWEDNVSRQHPDRLDVSYVRQESRDEKPEAVAGETIKAIVRSPFKGTLLLTVETDRVLETYVQEMDANVAEVAVKVPEGCGPNAYLCATVVRRVDPKAKWRTHRAFGVQRIPMSREGAQLNVALSAPKEIRPGTTLDVGVRVTDAGGAGVPNTALALVAVDEGVCQATNFATPDPLGYFWSTRGLGVVSSDLYSELMPEIAKPAGNRAAGGDGDGDEGGARHLSVVSARRVRPVALIQEILHTDADGNAVAHFQVPAFLGQLRVMAVAYSSDKVGSAAAPVFVRAPVVAQSSFPRFAAPGDSFDVPVTVFNNTDTAGEARITLMLSPWVGAAHATIEGKAQPATRRAVNFDLLSDEVMPRIKVAAHSQATHVFHVKAGDTPGVVSGQLSVTLNDETFHDAPIELPIRPAAPIITKGDYQIVSPEKPYTFTIPNAMLPGTATLDLRVTPRPTLNLPRGLEYLEQYPYGCLEQTTSKCFPLVYLSDIGETIGRGAADKDRVAGKIQHGITRLYGMTAPDGGLGMWPGDRASWRWGTVYAAHFLVEAEAAGHKVPADLKTRTLDYCRGLLTKSEPPGDMTETQAYACYVLALAGKPNRVAMNRLKDVIDAEAAPDIAASMASARFFLAAAQLASGRKDLAAASVLPQNLPAPRSERQLAGNVGSSVRDQALMLSTLLAIQPEHPQVHALAQALAESGRHNKWTSTQDTAWAVMALGRYLRATKSETPFASAEIWQDGKKLASTDAASKTLVWTTLPVAPTGSPYALRVTGEAASRAHLTWSLTGIPATAPADADHGVKIRRRYLSQDDTPLSTLDVATGTLVKVQLTVDTATAIQNLVIEDLLPAGLEIENPRLATSARLTASAPLSPQSSGLSPRPFLPTRVDMRDDRLIVVGNVVGNTAASPTTYTYLARAVTPGTFAIPPVRGEAMYDIALNSLSNTAGKFVVRGK